jgi:glycosyltransferase involved in cell wall biosynthesis
VRILLLTPFLPDPEAPHGGGSYLGSLAEGLRTRAELGLVHLHHLGEPTAREGHWSWQASADYQGAPKGAAHRLRMLWRWRSRPLLAGKYWHIELPRLLKRARAEFSPDAVMVEMAQMAQYLPYLQGLPTVFTDHEAGQPANKSTGLGPLADRRDDRLWQRYLTHFYPQASQIQAVTQEDADNLSAQLGRPVHVRPPTITIPAVASQPSEAPPHALFLGDYRHGPNPEAAERLAREIWPLVRETQPTAELLLAGRHDEAIQHLAELPGVKVLGFVPDLADLFRRVRVVLSPLWSGRGFRAKSATALAHGVPIVTNELGSRGCQAPGPACSIGESNAELAGAAARHLASAEYAEGAGQAARKWAIENYAADAVAQMQLDRIEALLPRSPAGN